MRRHDPWSPRTRISIGLGFMTVLRRPGRRPAGYRDPPRRPALSSTTSGIAGEPAEDPRGTPPLPSRIAAIRSPAAQAVPDRSNPGARLNSSYPGVESDLSTAIWRIRPFSTGEESAVCQMCRPDPETFSIVLLFYGDLPPEVAHLAQSGTGQVSEMATNGRSPSSSCCRSPASPRSSRPGRSRQRSLSRWKKGSYRLVKSQTTSAKSILRLTL